MSDDQENTASPSSNQLEEGTYEIIRNRLRKHGDDLQNRLSQLNEDRKNIFGNIETSLVASERITTQNKCVPRDMVPLKDHFIFAYNVHIGLRTTTQLTDVFSIYEYKDHAFHANDLKLISDPAFIEDFNNLYKYYRETQFSKFARIGPYLYMVFQVGKSENDRKTFKWKIKGNQLVYVDNRSDAEVAYPDQHEFQWKRTRREMYREGLHPHISIADKVFVETIGGDLTIKG